ncbi:alpha-glucosidase [Colwellia psychrerythraea]|uniref:Alpha-glucosidase n=1 Tax=Colwellia psychrerythraea TaxID=28229 RepID=A0A1Y5EF72_COLPS|nr:alpha-glucosidase [Colwellia psychrerythraea]
MNKIFLLTLGILVSLVSLMASSNEANNAESLMIKSPNNTVGIEFILANGAPHYRVFTGEDEIISPSKLGFRFKDQQPLLADFTLVSSFEQLVQKNWQKLWGQSKNVSNHYRELHVKLKETTAQNRELHLIFRAYNDGVAFRYALPEQANLGQFSITSEETEFAFNKDHSAWWIPANYDSYEANYQKSLLSEVTAINTPVTMKTTSGLYLSVHEAALTNYAGMTLIKKSQQPLILTSDLVPWPDGVKVKAATPFETPWRTIQIGKTAGELIESNLIVNLNEPSVIKDTSWIKPMKYVGIWWGMHMRKYTWEAGDKHGATTENTKKYIDFAKEHNIGGVLVEGWNKGWETWHTGVSVQDFTQAYDDFDLAEIAAYGKENNVALIGHHETGGNIPLYEQQLEKAMALYQRVGVHAIKTGYAGKMIPKGSYHHGQFMVNHYRKVLELAAKHQIMLNVHEPIKPTGIRRTYPNMMTREGAKGMEWNGWSDGNSPEHTVTLPFTRLLAGPLDYTPGIFNIKFDPQQQYRVHSTLAKQLAMYVVLYSPMQMAADMIENYADQPAFEFIEQVPVSWDETCFLQGEIGDYISIARRQGEQWFIGSMTDEQPRNFAFDLDFLSLQTTYVAKIYSDAIETEFVDNPTAVSIGEYLVRKGDSLATVLASGGGQAVHLYPAQANDIKQLKTIASYNAEVANNIEVFAQGSQFGEIKHVSHLAVNKTIKLLSEYDQGYSGGARNALVDGIIGNSDYKSLWQGYRKKDLDVVIDLGKQMPLQAIEIGFLQSQLHSILLPSKVEFSISTDGKTFNSVGSQLYYTAETIPDFQKKQFSTDFKETTARYVRVHATNLSELPDWHVRPGQETFIFADEIQVH